MRALGVIPSRYHSSRFPGKPLADICGKPMLWWVYEKARQTELLDDVVVATDHSLIEETCREYDIPCIMTASDHNTPTSRLHEVSQKLAADYYVFIGGDEPLIEPVAIDAVVRDAIQGREEVVNAMTVIKSAPEVIDFTNIKVVVTSDNYLLYCSRSPIPYPKGSLEYEFKKFVGIGAFSGHALEKYEQTPKGVLEKIDECDLIRFLDLGIRVKMTEVECRSVSVDTPKDIEKVIALIMGETT